MSGRMIRLTSSENFYPTLISKRKENKPTAETLGNEQMEKRQRTDNAHKKGSSPVYEQARQYF